MPGAPVLKASAGAASSASGIATRSAARAGRRRAALAAAAIRERCGPFAPRPIGKAFTRSPSRARIGGSAATAITTPIAVTTAAALAIEKSSEPGCRKAERTIAARKVEPARTAVRPALTRVRRAASAGARPCASSSRKRETISSE